MLAATVKQEGWSVYCKGLLKRYWADFALLLIVFVLAQALIYGYLPTHDRFLMERDPTFSHPFVEQETVTDVELFLYMGIIPLLVLWSTQVIVFKIWPDHELVQNPVRPTLTMLDAWAFALLFTNLMKNYAGRPRPNFFAYCNYKGYRDAMTSGNYTAYYNNTTFGRPIMASSCGPLLDARHSFPSGHASFSMASLLTLALFWYGVAELQKNHKLYKMTLFSMLPLLAWVVAGSRTRDYYHHFDDVAAGSVIGGTAAVMCFVYSYNSRTRRGTPPGGEDSKPTSINSNNNSNHASVYMGPEAVPESAAAANLLYHAHAAPNDRDKTV